MSGTQFSRNQKLEQQVKNSFHSFLLQGENLFSVFYWGFSMVNDERQ